HPNRRVVAFDRAALTPPADREESNDELVSSRTNARRDLVRLYCQGLDGGRRGRPARTSGHAEAGGLEASRASAFGSPTKRLNNRRGCNARPDSQARKSRTGPTSLFFFQRSMGSHVDPFSGVSKQCRIALKNRRDISLLPDGCEPDAIARG